MCKRPPAATTKEKGNKTVTKLDNKKFLLCDPANISSALMMRMTLEKVLKKYGVKPAKVLACLFDDGKIIAPEFDVLFCAQNFTSVFHAAQKKDTVVLGLKNIISDKEMERVLWEAELLN